MCTPFSPGHPVVFDETAARHVMRALTHAMAKVQFTLAAVWLPKQVLKLVSQSVCAAQG
jgi:predicted kinase